MATVILSALLWAFTVVDIEVLVAIRYADVAAPVRHGTYGETVETSLLVNPLYFVGLVVPFTTNGPFRLVDNVPLFHIVPFSIGFLDA